MTDAPPTRLEPLSHFAAELGVRVETVEDWHRRGRKDCACQRVRLRAVRLGGLKTTQAWLDEFVEALSRPAPVPAATGS